MQQCDLVMKGGITSGVVYPQAVTEITNEYRLRQVGGASAGAIAAVFAAAAEYERQNRKVISGNQSARKENEAKKVQNNNITGFEKLSKLSDYLAKNLRSLFQPDPVFKRVFDILMASVSENDSVWFAVVKAIVWQIGLVVIMLGLGIWQSFETGNLWKGVAIAMIGLLVAGVWAFVVVKRVIFNKLPKADFGMCSGKTIGDPSKNRPAFTDWIRKNVDDIAGKTNGPLTIGDLDKYDITLAIMTSDLSTGRPYRLPFQTRIHYFSKREFERLFDRKFVDYLCKVGGRHEYKKTKSVPEDLYKLPVGPKFPVALAARMSLSFPGLIAGVPLYRDDHQIDKPGDEKIRRCLFSDGGISSNFPIHFFDSLLPRRPTFGITLGVWETDRHSDDDRVTLPLGALQSTNLPVRPIGKISEFVSSILYTAKDWQDTLQSMMPGYADRIVTIRLDPNKEGGMNLDMKKETIETLGEFGRQAGELLASRFSYVQGGDGFDQHRYYRAISVMPKLEKSLEGFADVLESRPDGVPTAKTTSSVLTEFDTALHKTSKSWRRSPFLAFAEALAGIGKGGAIKPQIPPRERIQDRDDLPHFDATIRLVATADRVPKR